MGCPKLVRAVKLAKVPGLWDALVEAEAEEGEMGGGVRDLM